MKAELNLENGLIKTRTLQNGILSVKDPTKFPQKNKQPNRTFVSFNKREEQFNYIFYWSQLDLCKHEKN